MRFFAKKGDERFELDPSSLSRAETWQAAAVSDCIARMIPHEGVDYELNVSNSSICVIPLTDKGESWRNYVKSMMKSHPCEVYAGGDTRKSVMEYLGSMIPSEGVDYDVTVTFLLDSARVTLEIAGFNEKGRFWRSHVMGMLKKYPPTTAYVADMLPENPEMSDEVMKEFQEV